MFFMRKPADSRIRDFLIAQVESDFSYSPVGISAQGLAPRGYITDHNRIQLGRGERVWNAAIAAMNSWKMFRISWMQLCWPLAPIAGANVAALIQHFRFWSLNPCRIIYVEHKSHGPINTYAFAYGTLLEHSESGEERFSIEWHSQDDSVWYDLYAFSRPRAALAKFAYPLARRLQRRFAEDSKTAMASAVALCEASAVCPHQGHK